MGRKKYDDDEREYRYQDKLYGQIAYGCFDSLEPGEPQPIQCNDRDSFGGRYYAPQWAVTDRRVWSIERGSWMIPYDDGNEIPKYWRYKAGGRNIDASNLIANYRCDKDIIMWTGAKAVRAEGIEHPTLIQIMRAGEALVDVHHIRAYGPLPKELLSRSGNEVAAAKLADSMIRDRASNLQYILHDDHKRFVTPLSRWQSSDYDIVIEADAKVRYYMDSDDPVLAMAHSKRRAGYKIIYHEDGSKEFRVVVNFDQSHTAVDPDTGYLISVDTHKPVMVTQHIRHTADDGSVTYETVRVPVRIAS